MKKILIFLLILGMAIGEEWFVIEKPYVIRSDRKPNPGRMLAYTQKGEEYKILEKYAGWIYVKFVNGTDHVGQMGWVYEGLVNDNNRIMTNGVAVHNEPKKGKKIFVVRDGAEVKILKYNWSWIKVDLSTRYIDDAPQDGWVYIKSGKIENRTSETQP